MRAGIAVLAVMSLAIAATPAYVRADTGNEMADACREFLKERASPGKEFRAGVCAGFVRGVTDTLAAARLAAPEKIFICLPTKGFTIGQATRVLMKYFDDHPETLNESAIVLAVQAYRAAYECK